MNKTPVFGICIGILALLLAGILPSCAPIAGRSVPEKTSISEADHRARRLISELLEENTRVLHAKGRGDIALTRDGRVEQYRAAWIAAPPRRLRLTLLSMGLPVETVVSDGNGVTFFSHTGAHPVRRLNRENPSLKSVIGIPVHLSDIVSILTGRIPIRSFQTIEVEQTPNNGLSILLRDGWKGRVQRLVFNGLDRLTGFDLLDNGKTPVVTVRLNPPSPDTLPSRFTRIFMADPNGQTLEMTFRSFTPDIALKPGYFILTPRR